MIRTIYRNEYGYQGELRVYYRTSLKCRDGSWVGVNVKFKDGIRPPHTDKFRVVTSDENFSYKAYDLTDEKGKKRTYAVVDTLWINDCSFDSGMDMDCASRPTSEEDFSQDYEDYPDTFQAATDDIPF